VSPTARPAAGLALLAVAWLIVAPRGAAAHWVAGEMAGPGPHPRVALVPADLPVIHGRLDREPYLSLLGQLVWLAEQEWPLDDHDVDVERGKASTARAAAWLFALDRTLDEDGRAVPFPDEGTRAEMGDKAARYLLSMYTVSRAKGFIEFTDDIHTAQELHLWAETLDLLLGAEPDALGDDRALATQQVADLAADLYADFCISNWIPTRALVNNHRTKTASALGIAAIALNGEAFEAAVDDSRYDPALWLDFGLRNVDFTARDILTDADGGYQEGGAYLAYAGIDLYPFLRAWSVYTGGASYELGWDEPVPPYYELGASGSYLLPDPWTDPELERQLDWLIRAQMPDGSAPPVDDCTPGGRLFLGAFVQPDRPNAGLYRWAWEHAGLAAGGSVDSSPLLLATYDDSVPPVTPTEAGLARHQLLPHGGQVVFRGGWEDDDLYLALQCEHGVAAALSQTRWGRRIDGAAGHEHADAASLLLAAGGETLILDPGYLGWEDHEKVWAADDHNLILVDGLGPSLPYLAVPLFDVGPDGELVLLDYATEGGWTAAGDGMAYLTAADVGRDGLAFARVTSLYGHETPETVLAREVTLLADRFAVLHDRVEVRDGSGHTLTHTLHTNCGGTSGGVYEPAEDGAWCSRDGARLRAVVLSPGGAEQTTREDEHDAGHWLERTHTVLETHREVEAGEVGTFLTVLLPEPRGEVDLPPAEPVSGGDRAVSWSRDGWTCGAWLDGGMAIAWPDPAGLPPADAGAACASEGVVVASLRGLEEDEGALLTLRMEVGEAVEGISAAILAHGTRTDRAELDLPAVAGAEPDGACDWWEDGDGGWRIVAPAPGEVRTAPSARGVVASARLAGVGFGSPAVVPLGEPATVDASESCALDGGAPAYRWTLVRAPELSWVDLPPAEEHGPALTFQPDLPGVYEVEVRVAAGTWVDTASVVLEVEGETGDGDDDDDDSADPGDPDPGTPAPLNRGPEGCACGSTEPGARAGWILLVALMGWGACRQRRPRLR